MTSGLMTGVVPATVATVGDPSATRIVYAVVIALAVLGLVLVVLAFWLLRSTKVDLEMLAPLERMGERSWRKRDPATQQRMLDEVRPDGAEPLWRADPAPDRDEEFDEVPISAGFDDLQDDALPGDDAPAEDPAVETAAGDDDESGGDGRTEDGGTEDGDTPAAAEAEADDTDGDEVAEVDADDADTATEAGGAGGSEDAEQDRADVEQDGEDQEEPDDTGDEAVTAASAPSVVEAEIDQPADDHEATEAVFAPPEVDGVEEGAGAATIDDDSDAGEEPVEVGR